MRVGPGEHMARDAAGDGIHDGVELATVGDNDMPGVWRAISTGEDHCWVPYRRDRQHTRMLASNDYESSFPYAIYIFHWNENIGHITIGFTVNYGDMHGVWMFGSWPDECKGEYSIGSKATMRMRFVKTGDKTGDNWEAALNSWGECEENKDKKDYWGSAYELLTTRKQCVNMKKRVKKLLNADGIVMFDEAWRTPLEHQDAEDLTHVTPRPGHDLMDYDGPAVNWHRKGMLRFRGIVDPNRFSDMYAWEGARNVPPVTTNYDWVLGAEYDCVHFANYIWSQTGLAEGVTPEGYMATIEQQLKIFPHFFAHGAYRDNKGVIVNCQCKNCKKNRKAFGSL